MMVFIFGSGSPRHRGDEEMMISYRFYNDLLGVNVVPEKCLIFMIGVPRHPPHKEMLDSTRILKDPG